MLDAIEFRSEAALNHSFQLRTEGGLLLTDCLQIHLFELPKYVPPSDNRVVRDPIEQWLYFFRRAGESSAEELTARLSDPVFAEAGQSSRWEVLQREVWFPSGSEPRRNSFLLKR